MVRSTCHDIWQRWSSITLRKASCAFATVFVMAGLQPAHADTFLLKDGTTIEGTIIRATKSSIAIKRAIGGLQLARLSSIEEVRVDRAGKSPIVGRLIGWTGGIHVVNVGGKIVEMHDGEVVNEMPSSRASIVIAKPAAHANAANGDRSSRRKAAGEQPSLAVDPRAVLPPATTPDPDDQAETVPSSSETKRASLEQAAEPEARAGATPAVAPAAKLDPAVNVPSGNKGDVMIDASVTPAREGESIVFDLRLSEPLEQPLVIVYTTIGGTAEDSADYEPQRGIITIEPGDTVAEVRTKLFDDDVAEGQEQFDLFLSVDPNLATLSERQATATIMDDD